MCFHIPILVYIYIYIYIYIYVGICIVVACVRLNNIVMDGRIFVIHVHLWRGWICT